MPRRRQNKRVRARLSAMLAPLEQRSVAAQAVFAKCTTGLVQLQCELKVRLSVVDALALVKSLLIASELSIDAKCERRVPIDSWRDVTIMVVRSILQEKGISASLAYTDAAQIEIDRPFARALLIVWSCAAPGSLGRTPDALIARARKIRRRKLAAPVSVLHEEIERIFASL